VHLYIVQKDINNLNHSAYLQEAVNSKADLICFGELSTTGILYDSKAVKSLDSLVSSFDEYPLGIMLGFPHQVDTKLYNGYLYYHQGMSQIYHKINLFYPMNEDGMYQSGKELGLFDTHLGRLGVALCFDLRFPDIFERLAELKADIIFVPAAFPLERIDDWKRLLVQRAIECRLPVVGINSVGTDGLYVFGGTSMVVDASGRVVVSAGETEEVVLDVEIDL